MYCGICATGTGKVLKFNPERYGNILNLSVIVKPGHIGTGSIQCHTWDRKANADFLGRKWYKDLPGQGGELIITPSNTQQSISFFQKNPNQNNFWDCCCSRLDNLNLLITIESF